jgi:hypothetical protein
VFPPKTAPQHAARPPPQGGVNGHRRCGRKPYEMPVDVVSGDLTPWILSIGGGIVTTLLGVIGKLWSERATERREHRDELATVRHELEQANERVVELQTQGQERSDLHQAEHRKDLRRLAGLSTSIEPPARDAWPPVIIRGLDARALPAPKKPRG